VWEGPLRPASKTYRIRIVHFRRTIFAGWTLANDYVTVHVVEPPDILGEVALACFFEPAALKTDHEFLAGAPQVPVAGVPGSGIELAAQTPDSCRPLLRIAVQERGRRNRDLILIPDP
jgi:hypothetical protein